MTAHLLTGWSDAHYFGALLFAAVVLACVVTCATWGKL